MNPVPWRFRNLICPWQTPREIKTQVATAHRVLARLTPDEARAVTREDEPDRDWGRPC